MGEKQHATDDRPCPSKLARVTRDWHDGEVEGLVGGFCQLRHHNAQNNRNTFCVVRRWSSFSRDVEVFFFVAKEACLSKCPPHELVSRVCYICSCCLVLRPTHSPYHVCMYDKKKRQPAAEQEGLDPQPCETRHSPCNVAIRKLERLVPQSLLPDTLAMRVLSVPKKVRGR